MCGALSIRTFSNTRSVVLLIYIQLWSFYVFIGCHCLHVDTVVVCVLILLLFVLILLLFVLILLLFVLILLLFAC